MKTKNISLAISLATIGGCTSLNVAKLPDDPDWDSRKGFPYALQMTQFKIDVTRGVASCEKKIEVTGPTGRNSSVTVPNVMPFVKAEITSTSIDDSEHTYVIDVESLNSVGKITGVEVKWENGRLTSINATADDQTLEAVGSIVTGIAQIAASKVSAQSSAAAGPTIPVVECDSTIKTAVAESKKLTKSIKANAIKVSGIVKKIAKLELSTKNSGQTSSPDCNLTANAEKEVCRLKKSLDELAVLQRVLKEEQKQLSEHSKKTSYTKTYRWPEDSSTHLSAALSLDTEKRDAWFIDGTSRNVQNRKDFQRSVATMAPEYDVYFKLASIGQFGRSDLTKQDDIGAVPGDGLRFRIPADGYVAVCRRNHLGCDRDAKELVVKVKRERILQLGHVFHVPFESKVFTKSEFAMTFDASGVPTMGKVGRSESPIQNVASLFKTVAQEYSAFRIARTGEADDALTNIQEETTILKAQKELLDAQKALNPEEKPIDILQRETALAEQQANYIKALQALEELENTDPNAPAIELIESETALIAAEVARLEAEIARRKAEETLSE